MKRYCGSCGAPRNEGAEFCGQCGQPFGAAPAAPQRKSSPRPSVERRAPARAPRKPRRGLRLVAGLALLALVAVAVGCSGWRNRPPDTGLQLTTLASQLLQPSSQPQTVTAPDKVSVTLPGGLLAGPKELTISEVENPPATSSQLYEPGQAYDISLAKPYDEAVRLLAKLRDLAEYKGEEAAFLQCLNRIYEQYSRRSALLRRLREAGLHQS